MTTTARDTRARTGAQYRFPDEIPSSSSAFGAILVDAARLSGDEGGWEDISSASDCDYDVTSPLRKNGTAARRPAGIQRRRRRAGNSTRRVAAGSTSRLDTPEKQTEPTLQTHQAPTESIRPPQSEHAKPVENAEEVKYMPTITRRQLVEEAVRCVSFISRYILDVVRTALTLLRKPLGLILFLCILAMILSMVSHTLRNLFAPLCVFPGIRSSPLCRPIPMNAPQRANFPRHTEVQTKTFESLLDETTGGSALSLEIKKAQMATSDLIVLVRSSKLKSKDVLSPLLVDFVSDAKKTGRRLQKLHAKVGGSVDSIMAANNYALQTIEEANTKKPFFSFDTLNPWSRSHKTQLVASTFNGAMDTLSTQISRLVIEAEANLGNLNDLEERLDAVHELVTRDTDGVTVDREELLGQLWTKLGGNKKDLKNFNNNLGLLKNIGKYRKQARVHVVAALQTLESLSEDMEELRERVATPGLVGESIPLEVQMKSIQYGLERLQENRIRARKVEEDAVRRVVGSDFVDEIDS